MLLAEAFLIHWRLADSGFRSWLVRVMAFTCEGWGEGVGRWGGARGGARGRGEAAHMCQQTYLRATSGAA